MRLTSKHVAVSVIGAVLTMAAQANAQVPGDEARTDSAPDAARSDSPSETCAGSCAADAAPSTPTAPVVVYDAPQLHVVDQDQLRFVVDRNAVRAGGWLLALVGLGAALTGIAAPMVGEQVHEPHGPHKSVSPSWAAPLAIGGGLGLIGGLVVVAACGPIPADQPARGQHDRTFGLGYRGTF